MSSAEGGTGAPSASHRPRTLLPGWRFGPVSNGASDIFPLAIHTGGLASALAGALQRDAEKCARFSAKSRCKL